MSGIDRDTINKIEDLVIQGQVPREIDGKIYSNLNLKRVYSDPRPTSLQVSTLDGVADYINNNLDGVEVDKCIIVIDSYREISVYSPVGGEKNDRHLILKAKLTDVEDFNFGRFLEQEEFIISLASLFKTTEEKTAIMSAVSSMTVIDDVSGDDNGATVSRAASSSVICGTDKLKPVVQLKPFRTFREVEQPESAFIFRFKKGHNGLPVIGLFEADGGAWKIQAKKLIKNYLSERVNSPIIS